MVRSKLRMTVLLPQNSRNAGWIAKAGRPELQTSVAGPHHRQAVSLLSVFHFTVAEALLACANSPEAARSSAQNYCKPRHESNHLPARETSRGFPPTLLTSCPRLCWPVLNETAAS